MIHRLPSIRRSIRPGEPLRARPRAGDGELVAAFRAGDRPGARTLAEHAVSIARTLDDPETLASCLSQHDVLGIAPPAPRLPRRASTWPSRQMIKNGTPKRAAALDHGPAGGLAGDERVPLLILSHRRGCAGSGRMGDAPRWQRDRTYLELPQRVGLRNMCGRNTARAAAPRLCPSIYRTHPPQCWARRSPNCQLAIERQ